MVWCGAWIGRVLSACRSVDFGESPCTLGGKTKPFFPPIDGQRVADLGLDVIHDLRWEMDQAEADRADAVVGHRAAAMRHADEDDALDPRVGVKNQRSLDDVVRRDFGVESVGIAAEDSVPSSRAPC